MDTSLFYYDILYKDKKCKKGESIYYARKWNIDADFFIGFQVWYWKFIEGGI